jgi:hypothetical protein
VGKKGRGARGERRALERELRKDVRERERLVLLAPGGAPDRPIPLESPAVVEPVARSIPCHQCGGELGVDEHGVDEHQGELLRLVRTTCRRCHARRAIWFRLSRRLPS